MAWGAASGASQWASKLRANDEKLNSLYIMPFRRMAEKDWIELCEASGRVLTRFVAKIYSTWTDWQQPLLRLYHHFCTLLVHTFALLVSSYIRRSL
jgi:hypothetical protein